MYSIYVALLHLSMGYAQLFILLLDVYEMTHPFENLLYLTYLYAIKVEDYVIILYERSMYTRYKYYVYVEVYVNFNVELMKSSKFYVFLT